MAKLIELKEAAEKMGLSPEQLTEMVDNKELFGYRDGSSWKFKPSEIERVVAENQQLKQALDRQTGIVNSLKDKLERSHPEATADLNADPTDAPKGDAAAVSKQQRETIEFCLKEVDRCLGWLQRN